MNTYRIALISLLTSFAFGCATSDDVAAVGRAAINTGLVAASIATGGTGSLQPENCEFAKSEYDRNVCQRKNQEIATGRPIAVENCSSADSEHARSECQRRNSEIKAALER